jgi:hypothetical protein
MHAAPPRRSTAQRSPPVSPSRSDRAPSAAQARRPHPRPSGARPGPWLLPGAAGLALLALGTGAWWLLDGDDRASAAEAVAALPLPREAAPAGEVLAPRSELEIAAGRLAAAAAEDPLEAERRATRRVQERGALELVVVDRARGLPLPGAEVLWSVVPDHERLDRSPTGIDGVLAERGQAATADAHGRAGVASPRVGERLLATARAGHLWGMLDLGPLERGSARLEVWPDAAVDLLVTGADGKPAEGVRAGLYQRVQESLSAVQVAATDSSGALTLAHAGYALARSEADGTWHVGVAEALAEPVLVDLDPERLPRFPVHVRLPAVGAIEVEVRDIRGQPLADGVCSLRLDERRPDGRAARARGNLLFATADIRGGRARFAHVGLGLELQLNARARGEPGSQDLAVVGPRAAGETVAARIDLGSQRPVLWLRAVAGPERVPLVNADLDLQLVAGGRGRGGGRGWSLSTDAEGRLAIELTSTRAEEGRWLLVEHLLPGTGEPLVGRADLSAAFPVGRSELGDVVLAAVPPIASGRVIGDDGAPVANARVELQVPQRERPERFQSTRLSELTDADGRFDLRVPYDGPRLRIAASATGRRDASVECDPGARDLELVLGRTGGLRGRLWPPGLLPFEGLQVRLIAQSTRAVRPTSPARDGVFAYGNLDPGLYDLTVGLPRRSEELLRIGGLLVPPGGECDDPRLERIDLTGLVMGVVLELVPPEGARLSGRVEWNPSDAPQERASTAITGPRVRLVSAARSLDLIVLADGHRSVALEGVREDLRVELQPTLSVRLRLRGAPCRPSRTACVSPSTPAESLPAAGRCSTGAARPGSMWIGRGSTACN